MELEFCVMTMNRDAKFEEELTCQFKTDLRNLTNLDQRAHKNLKNLHSNGCSYYSRQGDRWQFKKKNQKPNFLYLQIIPTNQNFSIY